MYSFKLVLCVIISLHLLQCSCNPVKLSVYTVLGKTKNDKNYNCPFVRNSSLLDPEPEELKECDDYNRAANLKAIHKWNEQDALCLLYYDRYVFNAFCSVYFTLEYAVFL